MIFFFTNHGMSPCDINERNSVWHIIKKLAKMLQNSNSVEKTFRFFKGNNVNVNNVDFKFFYFCKMHKMRGNIQPSLFKTKTTARIEGFNQFTYLFNGSAYT